MEYSIFGCRLNKYYLNQWLEYFRSHDFVDNGYLITTCEVTDRAKQKRVKLAKKKLSEGCHIYITGCGSLKRGKKISTDQFYGLYPELRPFSDFITLLPESPLQMQDTRSIMQEQFSYHVSGVMHHASNIHTKNFIVVQTGCDNYCTFCLTVHKRGVHITRPLEDIIADINESAQSGGKEVVLTGVNIAAWGCSNSTKPEQSKFAQLLQNILDHTAIPRIRLSSLGPEYLHDDIFPVLQNPRIMPHFHLSIQSFSDGVLQRMKRNYDSETLVRVLKKIRSLKTKVPVSIGADIIVGFPGETEKEFQETLAGIQKYKINKVHSFPFSAHQLGETIPASLLPDQIDAVTKKIREKELKKIADELAEQFHQLNKDIVHSVLVEGKGSGRTENYLKVSVDPKHKRGEMIQMKI